MFEFLFAISMALLFVCVIGHAANRVAPPRTPPKVVHYRTRDGLCYYSFSIERTFSGQYRSYVVRQPDYGNRARDAHSTHRYTDADGRFYICWSDPIRTEQDALRVSASWADATQEYIKSGQTF